MMILDKLKDVADGKALFITGNDGFKALLVVQSKQQPVTFEQAKPAIEQYLTAERRREFAQKEMKNLRGSAKIEYIGKFAEKPASALRQPPQQLQLHPGRPSRVSLRRSRRQCAEQGLVGPEVNLSTHPIEASTCIAGARFFKVRFAIFPSQTANQGFLPTLISGAVVDYCGGFLD